MSTVRHLTNITLTTFADTRVHFHNTGVHSGLTPEELRSSWFTEEDIYIYRRLVYAMHKGKANFIESIIEREKF